MHALSSSEERHRGNKWSVELKILSNSRRYTTIVSPTLSVIIPTHKRAVILRKCVEHLAAQTIAKDIEVIVVSDGHDSETVKLMKEFSILNSQFSITFLEIEKSHQGVARNKGVMMAQAPRVLFIGDDILLNPDACELHVQVNQQLLFLGHTTWDPAVGITPVMRWLETSGWQFGYPMIERYAGNMLPKDIQHRFTYTSHISLPTEVARKFPFREDVTLYGWEDIEWGWRLMKAGIGLLYEPRAKALHHHHITLEDSLKRMETIGRSARVIEKLNPELRVVPRGWKRLAYLCISALPTMKGKHAKAFLLPQDLKQV